MLDLIVIGGGPGGSAVALGAARMGWDVLLIDEGGLGGTCVQRGCIPTKALLHATESLLDLAELTRQELSDPEVLERQRRALNLDRLLSYRDKQTAASRDGLLAELQRSGVELLEGRATVTSERTVRVGDATYESQRIVLATGSQPALPPIPGLDLPGVYLSDDFLDPAKDCPRDLQSIVIIGGGVIGVELADVFNRLGIQVTILEALDRILPQLDRGLSRGLQSAFKKRGIEIKTGVRVASVEATEAGLLVRTADEESHACDGVLVATGRRAQCQGILEIEVDEARDGFVVDDHYQTSVPGIYAIGDCRSGSHLLAHEASADAAALLSIWQDSPRAPRKSPVIPACVYTQPEIAQVGLDEAHAQEAGLRVISARASTLSNARSRMVTAERGYCNLLFSEEGVLVGAQWLGERATDLIDELSLAIDLGLHVEELRGTVRPHPTFVETLNQALEDATERLQREAARKA